MTALCDTAPRSRVQVGRRFGYVYDLYRQGECMEQVLFQTLTVNR